MFFYKSEVFHGSKDGGKLSYPTINLDVKVLPPDLGKGVYASWVKIDDQLYPGATYFGPRLVKNEQHDVLEIYILDFSAVIYGKKIEFSMEEHIRGVMDFTDFSLLKEQISKDIDQVKEILHVK